MPMNRYRSKARIKFWQMLWLPVLIGICVVIVTLLFWRELVVFEQVQIARNVELAAINIGEDITAQIQTRILALERMAQRWQVRGGTSRDEWEDDASNYWQGYPGFQALQWIDSNNYVRWVIPLAGNQATLNRSLIFESHRRTTLETAKKNKNTTMTKTVTLIQGGKGFSVYLPLFLKNSSQNTQQKFDGFIAGVFRTNQLLDKILDKNLTQEYAIAIFDGSEKIYNNQHIKSQQASKFTHEIKVNINGVTWQIQVSPTPASLAKQQSPLAKVVLIGGITTALLLSWVIHITQKSRVYARELESINRKLVREISERQIVETSLQQSTAEVEDLYNNAPCGYHSLDENGRFVQINDTELNWLGYSRDEIIGKKFTEFLTAESQLIFAKNFPGFKKAGWVRDLEYEIIRRDSTILPVLLSATAINDAVGNFMVSRSTIFDITKRKQAESELRWQEALLRAMANASPLAFYVVDERNQNVLYFNHRFCEIWGIECLEQPSSVKKDGCADCQPISSNRAIFNKICQPLPIESEHELIEDEICLDKRIIRRCSAQIRDKQDEYFGRLYIFEDISERKQADTDLRNLSTALESAVEGIAQLDNEGRYIYVNQAYAQMLGYQPEKMIGMEWQNTVYPEDVEKVTSFYQQMLSQGKAEIEARAQRQDGSMFDKQVVMVKACDQSQKVIGNYCFVKDISDRREIERLKDEFVSVVSHELRTPLTSIRGSLGLVANGVLQSQPEKAQRMLEIAVNNSDRLIRLINDILDIERIESGKVMMTKQICDAGTLMTQSADEIRVMAEKAGVHLVVTPICARLCADPDRILQTLTNLLSNAIKFSSPGSSISLTAEVGSGEWGQGRGRNISSPSPLPPPSPQILFQVKDQGRGIPRDKLETIFERFQQVDASDSRKKGGTGLGLAICRSIIGHHDGQIWAESILGEGSTFYISLPVLSQENPAISPISRNTVVMVCDDDASVRAVVKTMLEEQGYEAISVASGQEAVEVAALKQPDVIFLNLMMPGMNGWDTLAALKQQPETQRTPVIILSGLMPDARITNLHPEVSDWIIKPPDEKLLFQALTKALSGNSSIKVLIVEDDIDLAQVLITTFERHGIKAHHARTGREAIELSQSLTPYLLVLDLGLPEVDGFAVVDWLRHHNHLHQVPLVVYSARDLSEGDRTRLNLGQTLFLTKGRVTHEEFEQQAIALLNCIVSEKREAIKNVR
jgi:PAS domain S-box-containing protein